VKLIVAGTRTYNNKPHIEDILSNFDISLLLCGMCRGPDMIAHQYCRDRNIAIKEFRANWKEFGKAAGPMRNADMAAEADYLVAFWNGYSRGTANMINEMKRLNKATLTIEINTEEYNDIKDYLK
jgi:hypothetical protein